MVGFCFLHTDFSFIYLFFLNKCVITPSEPLRGSEGSSRLLFHITFPGRAGVSTQRLWPPGLMIAHCRQRAGG